MAKTSPIEKMLGDAIRHSRTDLVVRKPIDGYRFELVGNGHLHLEVNGDPWQIEEFFSVEGVDILVMGSVWFVGYRLDFLVIDNDGNVLGVECDGHEWHERTKQQASSDRARDRAMLLRGLPVVRFTGSDIHRDAEQCAKDALDLYESIVERKRALEQRQFCRGWDMGIERAAGANEDPVPGTSAGLVG